MGQQESGRLDAEVAERWISAETGAYFRSAYAVWELTLACNQSCIHCGSRAGVERPDELRTEECLDLVRQLAELEILEVAFSGGEAFLRPDWLEIAREVRRHDMRLTLITGGFGLGPEMAEEMAAAGFDMVSVSVDGLEETHDGLRGRSGSWRAALAALEALRAAGLRTAANTQINRRNAPELPRLFEVLRETDIRSWQPQLTVPSGAAADRPDLLLQPAEILDLQPLLHHLLERATDAGLLLMPGANVGYFGPYERRFRSHPFLHHPEFAFWVGDHGGVRTLGIEADGTVKPHLFLPTDAYAAGNVRILPLGEMLESSERLALFDNTGTDHLWGFCAGCEFSALCRGGDTWTAHAFFDRRGNNPYCHHRSLFHAAEGRQERLFPVQKAGGRSFDNAVFEISVESFGEPDKDAFDLSRVEWPAEWLAADPQLPQRLVAERDRAIEVWRQTRLPRKASGDVS